MSTPNPHLDTIDEIRALAKLPKGWDSYDGDTADDGAMASAIALVRAMYGRYPGAPRPEVGLVADGSVMLRWILPTREFELTYRASGDGGYVVSERQSGRVIEGSLRDVINPLNELIAVYVTGPGIW
jgi:hypothetical protein